MLRERYMSRTTLCVRTDQLDELRRLSSATGVPVSWMVRRGIDAFVRGNPAAPDQGRSGAVDPQL